MSDSWGCEFTGDKGEALSQHLELEPWMSWALLLSQGPSFFPANWLAKVMASWELSVGSWQASHVARAAQACQKRLQSPPFRPGAPHSLPEN